MLAAIWPLAATAGTPMPGNVLSPQHSKPADVTLPQPHGQPHRRKISRDNTLKVSTDCLSSAMICTTFLTQLEVPARHSPGHRASIEGTRTGNGRVGAREGSLPRPYAWTVGALMPPQETLVREWSAHLHAGSLSRGPRHRSLAAMVLVLGIVVDACGRASSLPAFGGLDKICRNELCKMGTGLPEAYMHQGSRAAPAQSLRAGARQG